MSASGTKRLLLRPEDFAPSSDGLEVIGAFNPGAAELSEKVVLLVRIAERPAPRPGMVGLPRWEKSGVVVDWLPESDVEFVDPRVVRIRQTGLVRLTFISHLRVVHCGEGLRVESLGPAFAPEMPWEEFGVEDARITRIDERYYITYVAVSRHGVATALASTEDFRTFQREGIIFSPENKDVVLFPAKIGGRYRALHRPSGATPFTTPEMWLAGSSDLIHWGGHQPLQFTRGAWESGRVGAGAPPVRIAEGWLILYHGNLRLTRLGEVGAYHGAALILDADDPARVQMQSSGSILAPTETYEREGFVKDVVFPTGIVKRGDEFFVYYGAGDTSTAVWRTSVREMVAALRPIS